MGIGIGTAADNGSDEGTVLAIVSNALRLPYDFADEVRRIHDSAAASRRFRVSAHWSCAPATIRRLLETKEPEVVHVLAPRVEEDGSLWLTDHKGNPLRIGLDETVALFTGLPRSPKLVVVNTCESYPVAQALANCVGATIGMTGEILDHDAIAFADRLYQRLAAGAPLTEAFEDARLEVPRASGTSRCCSMAPLTRPTYASEESRMMRSGPSSRSPGGSSRSSAHTRTKTASTSKA